MICGRFGQNPTSGEAATPSRKMIPRKILSTTAPGEDKCDSSHAASLLRNSLEAALTDGILPSPAVWLQLSSLSASSLRDLEPPSHPQLVSALPNRLAFARAAWSDWKRSWPPRCSADLYIPATDRSISSAKLLSSSRASEQGPLWVATAAGTLMCTELSTVWKWRPGFLLTVLELHAHGVY